MCSVSRYTQIHVCIKKRAIQCSREYRKFLESISTHFNCSFMQLFIHATKATNLWSQQLFFSWSAYFDFLMDRKMPNDDDTCPLIPLSTKTRSVETPIKCCHHPFCSVETSTKHCRCILQRTVGGYYIHQGIRRGILNPLHKFCTPIQDSLLNCVWGYNIHQGIRYGDTTIWGYNNSGIPDSP